MRERKVKLVLRRYAGHLPATFDNADVVDVETGEALPAKDIIVHMPLAGLTYITVDMTLDNIEIIDCDEFGKEIK